MKQLFQPNKTYANKVINITTGETVDNVPGEYEWDGKTINEWCRCGIAQMMDDKGNIYSLFEGPDLDLAHSMKDGDVDSSDNTLISPHEIVSMLHDGIDERPVYKAVNGVSSVLHTFDYRGRKISLHCYFDTHTSNENNAYIGGSPVTVLMFTVFMGAMDKYYVYTWLDDHRAFENFRTALYIDARLKYKNITPENNLQCNYTEEGIRMMTYPISSDELFEISKKNKELRDTVKWVAKEVTHFGYGLIKGYGPTKQESTKDLLRKIDIRESKRAEKWITV